MNPNPSGIVIRDIADLAEMREIEQLQKEVWGVEDLDVYPALALRPQKDVGAILMGAFAEQKMAGFVFGFPGIIKGETVIHSDMLAVRPEFRSYGLGYSLKLAQRERAIEMGISRITWTYDPLQLRNANLNFGKLGVVADRYDINYYGQTSSFLHNFGTDRLWVTWDLGSQRVRTRIVSGAAPETSVEDLPMMVHVIESDEPALNLEMDLAERIGIQIPGNINQLKEQGEGKAERWREATRAAFTKALDSGYSVLEFVVMEDSGQRLGAYVLQKRRNI
jgi:chorismate synthase